MKKSITLTIAFALAVALLTGCTSFDVILRDSPASLNTIIEAFPYLVTDNTVQDGYFHLTADGETTLKVSHDYSLTGAEDLVLQTPLQPFVDAGLDPSALGEGYRADSAFLYLVADFGAGTGAKATLTDALFESVKAERTVLSYHAALDHYGIALPAGKIEWAKDHTKNDKDLVFILAAQPLADLGIDVQNIDGWVFMTMQDDAGKDFDVLLKPFSLES